MQFAKNTGKISENKQ